MAETRSSMQLLVPKGPEMICVISFLYETPGGTVGQGTALQAGSSRFRFSMTSLEFFIDIILLAALWSWGRLSL